MSRIVLLAVFVSLVLVEQTDAAQRLIRWRFRSVQRSTTCVSGSCSQPVQEPSTCTDGSCSKPEQAEAPVKIRQRISTRIINRSQAAYNHALKEAAYLAQRHTVGHPFGVAPGCLMAGTGCSFSAEEPNHCYKDLPESRLVARAVVRGTDGRYYWSAHYR